MDKLHTEALKLLDEGLLPADTHNVWIFIKIIISYLLVSVFSGGIGFYLGLKTIQLLH